jgi:RHS repeat-associated protein
MIICSQSDAIDQLLSESRTGYSCSYTYDGNGNRATRTLNSVTENYSYDAGDKLIDIKIGGNTVKSFGYDAAGRTTSIVTSAGTTSLTYDYESRVTGITFPNNSTNSYGYNGFNTRVSKSDSVGTHSFKRAGAGVTAPVLDDGFASYTPGVSERRSGATTYYHAGLKNVERQTDTSITYTAQRQHDAFGNIVSSGGTWKGPCGYGGHFGYQEDKDSGLRLLGHRYYDSSTGRFLTRDPIKDGRNWYGYCENNPLRRADADGLQLVDIIGAGGDAGVGGSLGYLIGDHLYQHGNDTLKWIQPGTGPGGGRLIHIDKPHGRNPLPHFNADTGPLRALNHQPVGSLTAAYGKPVYLRAVARSIIILGVTADVIEVATAPDSDKPKVIGGAIGGLGGSVAGAAIGTMLLPGLGTVVGGIVGGFLGHLGGRRVAGSIW